MHPVKMIVAGLLALPLAEIAVFVLVASLVGLAKALVLLALVSFAGLLVLRRVGSGAVRRLRTAAGNAEATIALDGAGMAVALAGILLLVPGFITGLLGTMVIFPVSRGWLLAALRRFSSSNRRPTGPQILDLAPDEWEALPSPRLPPRRRRSKGTSTTGQTETNVRVRRTEETPRGSESN
jgi:UPF0716 protein FxsA